MTKKVIIIHRWSGNPASDWYQWLGKELEKKGFEVFIPNMINTDSPKIETWVSQIKETICIGRDEIYFVGHSIGCQAIMRYLASCESSVNVKGAVFVAGWFKLTNLEDKESEKIAQPWIETPIDCDKIKNRAKKITVFLSDNEPYGFIEENAELFRNKLNAKVLIEKKRGHFTEDDKITTLPIVLKEILKISK
jgi:predicted alpha/beta hydrolase family esterase